MGSNAARRVTTPFNIKVASPAFYLHTGQLIPIILHLSSWVTFHSKSALIELGAVIVTTHRLLWGFQLRHMDLWIKYFFSFPGSHCYSSSCRCRLPGACCSTASWTTWTIANRILISRKPVSNPNRIREPKTSCVLEILSTFFWIGKNFFTHLFPISHCVFAWTWLSRPRRYAVR